jgi:hypothetical protein
LPASFWTPQQQCHTQAHPPNFHPTDLTGKHYRLHWRRK